MKLRTTLGLGIATAFAGLAAAIVAIIILYVDDQHVRAAVVASLLVILAALALALVMSHLVMRRVLAAIQGVSRAAGRVAQGDLSARVALEGRDELGDLSASFNDMVERLEQQHRAIDHHQAELEVLNRELQAINAQLGAVNRNYMEMLGFVAHELKNPLTSAMMGLHTVKDGYLGPVTTAQQESLQTVASSLDYFRDMIRNYLDLSRLEKGEVEAKKAYIPLHQRVLWPALADLARELEERQMVVEDRISEGKVVYADANLLRIVYENLLSNAANYGRQGGTILLEAQETTAHWILSVRNDGLGIPPDKLPMLFQKFGRLESPEHEGKRGTGLGLYICKEIVEAHGGEIWAESHEGEWVRFSFTLPMKANPIARAAGEGRGTAQAPGAGELALLRLANNPR
jgi:signal transduction histidine kinase